jgi:hypothetical protein
MVSTTMSETAERPEPGGGWLFVRVVRTGASTGGRLH